MPGEEHVRHAAALRGQGRYPDAIALIEGHLADFDDVTIVPALLQAIYAAQQLGDLPKAKALADQLAQHDPEIPTVIRLLGK